MAALRGAAVAELSSGVKMAKLHIYRRGGVVHMSSEAQTAHEYIAGRPTDIHGLAGEITSLRAVLATPSPKLSPRALAGVALSIDMVRMLIAALPSETFADLDFKELIFQDREPLLGETALLPVLLEASIRADHYRLAGARAKLR